MSRSMARQICDVAASWRGGSPLSASESRGLVCLRRWSVKPDSLALVLNSNVIGSADAHCVGIASCKVRVSLTKRCKSAERGTRATRERSRRRPLRQHEAADVLGDHIRIDGMVIVRNPNVRPGDAPCLCAQKRTPQLPGWGLHQFHRRRHADSPKHPRGHWLE
jgi:hypothetical protein